MRIYPSGHRPGYCLVRLSDAPRLRGAAVAPSVPPGVALDICGIGGGAVLNAARDSGQLSAVVIDIHPQGRVLNISMPVYAGGSVPPTLAERRDRISGWALAQFSVNRLLADALSGTRRFALAVSRRDAIASTPLRTVFGPVSQVAVVGRAPGNAWRRKFMLNADGLWLLTVSETPGWKGVPPDLQALFVIVAGSVIALLIWMVVSLLARNRARSEDRLRAILKHSPAAIFITDRNSRYVACNDAFDELLGLRPGSAIGRTTDEVLPPELATATRRTAPAVLAGETISDESTLDRDGERVTVSTLRFPLADGMGRVYATCGIANDISQHKRLEDQLLHLADYDSLTGLYNRRRLIEELDRQLRYAARYRRQGAVLMFDLKNLRVINDTAGHSAGDVMLKSLAEHLTAGARDTDVVARTAGDEFTILLPEATQQDALALARDIRSQLADRPLGPPITVSVGIAPFTGEEETTAEELLVCADLALHEASEAGGDRVQVYTAQANGVLTWAQRIRTALVEGRFVLHGQPIIDLRTGLITHHELLIRMLSEDGDRIPPAAFLPAAERFGLIHEIDEWVVQEGLKLALTEGGVAINLSGASIDHPPIIGAVREAVANGLDPNKVIFEITETAAATNLTAARLFAGTLNGIGCSMALDDFGMGFGSLLYLKNIPVQYIKIDMEFVRRLTVDGTDRHIIQSIVGMASALGKQTIAEGVEDQETLSALRRLGVDCAQGYLIGRPKRLSAPTALERQLRDAGDLRPEGVQPSRRSMISIR